MSYIERMNNPGIIAKIYNYAYSATSIFCPRDNKIGFAKLIETVIGIKRMTLIILALQR